MSSAEHLVAKGACRQEQWHERAAGRLGHQGSSVNVLGRVHHPPSLGAERTPVSAGKSPFRARTAPRLTRACEPSRRAAQTLGRLPLIGVFSGIAPRTLQKASHYAKTGQRQRLGLPAERKNSLSLSLPLLLTRGCGRRLQSLEPGWASDALLVLGLGRVRAIWAVDALNVISSELPRLAVAASARQEARGGEKQKGYDRRGAP